MMASELALALLDLLAQRRVDPSREQNSHTRGDVARQQEERVE